MSWHLKESAGVLSSTITTGQPPNAIWELDLRRLRSWPSLTMMLRSILSAYHNLQRWRQIRWLMGSCIMPSTRIGLMRPAGFLRPRALYGRELGKTTSIMANMIQESKSLPVNQPHALSGPIFSMKWMDLMRISGSLARRPIFHGACGSLVGASGIFQKHLVFIILIPSGNRQTNSILLRESILTAAATTSPCSSKTWRPETYGRFYPPTA